MSKNNHKTRKKPLTGFNCGCKSIYWFCLYERKKPNHNKSCLMKLSTPKSLDNIVVRLGGMANGSTVRVAFHFEIMTKYVGLEFDG